MEEEEEEAAAAAEADVGEGGDEGWWSRKSRPPASRQRCRRSASMATRWSADEGKEGLLICLGPRMPSTASPIVRGSAFIFPSLFFWRFLGFNLRSFFEDKSTSSRGFQRLLLMAFHLGFG